MSQPKSNHEQPGSGRRFRGLTIGLAVAAGASLALGGGLTGVGEVAAGAAGGSSSPTVIHLFQVERTLSFTNASNAVIQGYPPVGGHVKEDDVDYLGNHSHHPKAWTVTDHQFCTVVTAPATAICSVEFASGDSLIYSDDTTIDLIASSAVETFDIDGGTGRYAGDSGTMISTSVGNTNDSDLVIKLHRG